MASGRFGRWSASKLVELFGRTPNKHGYLLGLMRYRPACCRATWRLISEAAYVKGERDYNVGRARPDVSGFSDDSWSGVLHPYQTRYLGWMMARARVIMRAHDLSSFREQTDQPGFTTPLYRARYPNRHPEKLD